MSLKNAKAIGEIAKSVSETHKRGSANLIFLNTSDIYRGHFNHLDYSDVSKWPGQAKKSVRRNDILFSEIRPGNGRWAFVDFDSGDIVVSTKLMVIRANEELVRPKFLYFYLTSEAICQKLQGLAESRSGTFPQITFDDVSFLQISLPDLREQDRIIELIENIDRKVQLNKQLNETLEKLARVSFIDWFIDFGPVRRAQASPNDPVAIMGSITPDPARAANLAALFPATFGNDGLPVGWSEESLLNQAHWINGAAYKNMHFVAKGLGLPVVKIAELKTGISDQTKFTNTDLGAKYRIDDGELLFSWSGNPDTSIDAFIWTGGEAWLNQHIFAVRENGSMDRPLLHTMLKWLMPQFAELARNRQTTGLGHVTKDDMKRLMIAKPPKSVSAAFTTLVGPVFERAVATLYENRTLLETRDYILPRLMSGEVRVLPSAEAA